MAEKRLREIKVSLPESTALALELVAARLRIKPATLAWHLIENQLFGALVEHAPTLRPSEPDLQSARRTFAPRELFEGDE